MKKREKADEKAAASPYQDQKNNAPSGTATSGSSGGWQSLLASNKGLAKLASRKDALLRGTAGSPSAPSTSLPARPSSPQDVEFERAIEASVKETSRGNAEEDAAVEAAIRQSVMAVRQQGALPEPVRTGAETDKKDPAIFDDAEYQITDEEYQSLIEQAIQHSLAGQSQDMPLTHESGFGELDGSKSSHPTGTKEKAPDVTSGALGRQEEGGDDDENFRRAIEESKNLSARGSAMPLGDDDEYQRAIAASKEEGKSQRTEEDIVMEYVMKQSMAEAELQKQQGRGGNGKAPATNTNNYDDDDDDMKRALEESLKMSRGDDSGPSQ